MGRDRGTSKTETKEKVPVSKKRQRTLFEEFNCKEDKFFQAMNLYYNGISRNRSLNALLKEIRRIDPNLIKYFAAAGLKVMGEELIKNSQKEKEANAATTADVKKSSVKADT